MGQERHRIAQAALIHATGGDRHRPEGERRKNARRAKV
jgi:hypothetical protein